MNDEVAYKENIIKYIEFEYILLNKPAGVVSATEDRKEKTVLDIIESKRKDLFLWEDLIRIRKDFCCLPMTECLHMSFYLLKNMLIKSIMWRLTDFLPMNTGNCLKRY